MKKKVNTVILVMSHVMDKEVQNLFEQIKRDCNDKFDVVFLCDNTRDVFADKTNNKDYFLFTLSDLSKLGYPGKSSIIRSDEDRRNDPHHKKFNWTPGSAHLPVHLFFRQNPGYDYYWLVEYDVRFTGSWKQFFSYFEDSEADLLGTTLVRHEHTPDWYYWPSFDLRDSSIKKRNYIRGFFPIYRLSNSALVQISSDYRAGNEGNYEGLLPTLLLHAGMTVEDIGGDGEFVRPQNINRFYRNTPSRGSLSPGTFVFRPIMHKPGKQPDTLWHPVKYMPPWEIALAFAKRVYWSARRRIVG